MVSFGNRVQTVGVHMHTVKEKGCGFLSGQKSASDSDSLTQDRGPKQTVNFLEGQRADWEDMKRGRAEGDLRALSCGYVKSKTENENKNL